MDPDLIKYVFKSLDRIGFFFNSRYSKIIGSWNCGPMKLFTYFWIYLVVTSAAVKLTNLFLTYDYNITLSEVIWAFKKCTYITFGFEDHCLDLIACKGNYSNGSKNQICFLLARTYILVIDIKKILFFFLTRPAPNWNL